MNGAARRRHRRRADRDHLRHAERQGGASSRWRRCSRQRGVRLPVMISGTVTDASGRILSGQTVEAFWNSVRHARPLTIGLNCALGAALMRPTWPELSKLCDTYVCCLPQRRPAQPHGRHRLRRSARPTPSGLLEEFARAGLVNIAGGCCGTTPDHIRAIAAQKVARAGAARGARACRSRPACSAAWSRSTSTRNSLFVNVRRAHQRHGQQDVRPPDPRREIRRGAGRGAPAGRERRPDHRRQHGRGHAGFGGVHGAFPEPDRLRAGHRPRAGR